MIDLTVYDKIQEAQDSFNCAKLEDLVCLSNIRITDNISSSIVEDFGAYVRVKGIHSTSAFVNRFAVVGREIVKITGVTTNGTNSDLTVERAQYGTINSYSNAGLGDYGIREGYYFNTVDIFDINEFTFNSSSGNNSDIFSFQLETGNVKFSAEKTFDWKSSNPQRKYKFRHKLSGVHIFRGYNSQRVLLYTGYGAKIWYGNSKTDRQQISIDFRDWFTKYYNTPIKSVITMKNLHPKEFFMNLFGLNTNMVYYANGLTEDKFPYLNTISSKEFKTYKEMLDIYTSCGIRFCSDELGRIKIFSDIYGSTIIPSTEIPINETNLTDISENSDNLLIRNKIVSSYKERKTMFEWEGKWKKFKYNITPITYTLINSADAYNQLNINNDSLFKYTVVNDYIMMKEGVTGKEFYGKVLEKKAPNTTSMLIGMFDKDYLLDALGKMTYLKGLGYNTPKTFTLHYSISELPTICKLSREFSGGTRDYNLNYPILPQVTGQEEELTTKTFAFGSPENLKVGTYSGIYEHYEEMLGTWNNTKLPYNREYEQFGGTLPPVAVLSNRITVDKGNANNSYMQFDTFDNSNLELGVFRATRDGDIVMDIKNTTTIPSLASYTPLEWSSPILLKVDSLANFRVGDVLTVKEKPNMTVLEQNTYEQTKNIRYFIQSCITESGNYYLLLSDNFPSGFSFNRYPYSSIVYLQELYMKGNPVIEKSQEFVEYDYPSIEEFEESEYTIDGRILSSKSLKDFVDYFKKNFNGLNKEMSIIPLECRDKFHVQKYDVIRVKDSQYTHVDNLFLVLGVSHKNKDPKVRMDCIRINTLDSNGDYIKFKEVLDYKITQDSIYTYTELGGSDVSKPVINEKDEFFGQLSLKLVPRTDFRCKVKTLADNNITLDTFAGTNQEKFKELFFTTTKTSEFVILCNQEYIYVKAYPSLISTEKNCSVIKRNVFNSPTTDFTKSQDVTFYEIAMVVDTTGKLTSTGLTSNGEFTITNPNNRLYFDPKPTGVGYENKSQLLMGVGWSNASGALKPELENIQFQVGEDSGLTTDSYIKYDQGKNSFIFKLEELDLRYAETNATLSPVTAVEAYKTYKVKITTNTTVSSDISVSLGGSSTYFIPEVGIQTIYLKISTINTDWVVITPNPTWQGTYNMDGVFLTETSLPVIKFRDKDGFQVSDIRVSDSTSHNLSFGYNSLSNSIGKNNLSFGLNSMLQHLYGDGNTVYGNDSSTIVKFSEKNTIIGYKSLYECTGAQSTFNKSRSNTIIGFEAIKGFGSSAENVIIGSSIGGIATNNAITNNIVLGVSNFGSLGSFTQVAYSDNIVIGKNSMTHNGGSSKNIVIGHNAIVGGISSTTSMDTNNVIIGNDILNSGSNFAVGLGNTIVGTEAGKYAIGTNITAVGRFAMSNTDGFTNSTGLGFDAQVTGSNQVRIGNGQVTQIGGNVAWSNLSDIRMKENITETKYGLDFILSLKPIDYTLKSTTDFRIHSGYSAQHLRELLKESHGMLNIPESDEDMLSIVYTEIIPALTKAIQELNRKVEEYGRIK